MKQKVKELFEVLECVATQDGNFVDAKTMVDLSVPEIVERVIERPKLEDEECDLIDLIVQERDHVKELKEVIHDLASHIVDLHQRYEANYEDGVTQGRRQVQDDIDASESLIELIRNLVKKD